MGNHGWCLRYRKLNCHSLVACNPVKVRKTQIIAYIFFFVALDCVVVIPMFTPMIVRVSFPCSQIYKLSVAILFRSDRRLTKPGQTHRTKNLPGAPQGPPRGPPKTPPGQGCQTPLPRGPPRTPPMTPRGPGFGRAQEVDQPTREEGKQT